MLLIASVNWLHYIFMIPLLLLSVFMILVILVQRGRGGGLTGALGGMGGQSAFGTKAGDLFTRITIVVAAIWVLLSMASIKVLSQQSATASMDPSQRGQVTTSKSNETAPGTALPSATVPGKKAESDSSSAPEGATAQPPETSSPSSKSSAPASAPGSGDTKPADAAKP
jgi:preprotein translocase subunit SecG